MGNLIVNYIYSSKDFQNKSNYNIESPFGDNKIIEKVID
jgi:hypothetical protein